MNRTMAEAFNEWMRLYTDNPEAFQHEWRSVGDFLKSISNQEIPSYGVRCEVFLNRLMGSVESVLIDSPEMPKEIRQ